MRALAGALMFCLLLAGPAVAASSSPSNSAPSGMKNSAIGGGAVTLYGLKNHHNTTTVLGASGTAYALSQYEKKRHQQSSRAVANARWHRKHPHGT